MNNFQTAREFAQFIKGLGFRVFIADSSFGYAYGFITDAEGSRVLSFKMSDGGLSGNYGPPTKTAGTGWRMNASLWDLKTFDDVRQALYASPPDWCRRKISGGCLKCDPSREGWEYFTTLDQHLAQYGKSSKYQEI